MFFATSELNACLIKTHSDGLIEWSKKYGGNINISCFDGQQTSYLGYVLFGKIQTYVNGSGVLFSEEFPMPNTNRKLVMTIDLIGREIYTPQKNVPYIEIYDDGTTKKKIIIK